MAGQASNEQKHVLICTLGESAEVVTEVLDKLLAEEKVPISEVVLIHPNDDKVLYGGEDWVVHEHCQGLEPKAVPVWIKGLVKDGKNKPYLKQEFEQGYKIPGQECPFHIKLIQKFVDFPDISDRESNASFARGLFKQVLDYHLKGGYAVHISLAGGRKTMSAYALLAAVLFGAAGLYHVLVPDRLSKALRVECKFHIGPSDLSPGEKYQLINISFPNLGEFLSEEAGEEDGLTPALQRAKIWLDVVNKLAAKEKQESEKGFSIFRGEVQDFVSKTLGEEIDDVLKQHQQEDVFPGPWQALRITFGQDLGDPFEVVGKVEGQFRLGTIVFDQGQEQVEEHTELDVLIFDIGEIPDQTVLGFIQRTRRFFPHLPIIALTSGRRLSEAMALTQAGAVICLERQEAYRVPFALPGLFRPREIKEVAGRVSFQGAEPSIQGWSTDDIRTLVAHLFPEAEQIQVQRAVVGGVSSNTKLWAWPDGQPMPYFMKLGPATELGQEKVAYERYVRGYLDNFSGRIERDVIFHGQEAALAYTAVGLPGHYGAANQTVPGPEGLDAFIQRHEYLECERLVKRLLEDILPVWYRRHQSLEVVVGRVYGKILPAWAELQWEGFGSNKSLVKLGRDSWKPRNGECVILEGEIHELDGSKKKLQISAPDFGYKISFIDVDPGVFASRKLHYRKPVTICGIVTRTLDDIIRQGAREAAVSEDAIIGLQQTLDMVLDTRRRLKQSVIHGDLNLGNVRTDGTNVWLIDFARTGWGPSVYDLAKLEIETRVVLANDIEGETLDDFGKFEAAVKQDGSSGTKPLYLVRMIRQHGLKYCVNEQDHWEYYATLLIYSLASLKFPHDARIKRQLLAAALAGAKQLKKNSW